MRALGWIVGIVVLLLVAVGVYVVMNSSALLGRAIETHGSRYLGAPVSVGGVDVSLREGSAGIRSLEVGNPPPFSGPPAFRLGGIAVTIDSAQVSSELIVLTNVTVDGAQVAALVRGRESNLQRLMDNLEANTRAAARAEQTGVQSEVKLIIDRFSFTNASASVDSDLFGGTAVDIPDVHLTDIGRQANGATIGQVLQQVMQPIVRAVTREMVDRGVDLEGVRDRAEQDLRERVGTGLDGLRDRLRGEP
jgi:hypothetical protein